MTKKLVGSVARADLPPGTMQRLPYPPFDVLVVNLMGVPYAIEDACNHAGASLAEGSLKDDRVICPAHGYIFDVRTGVLIAPKGLCGPQRTFDVVGEGDAFVVYDSFPSPFVVL